MLNRGWYEQLSKALGPPMISAIGSCAKSRISNPLRYLTSLPAVLNFLDSFAIYSGDISRISILC
jgi:hypothetical protein